MRIMRRRPYIQIISVVVAWILIFVMILTGCGLKEDPANTNGSPEQDAALGASENAAADSADPAGSNGSADSADGRSLAASELAGAAEAKNGKTEDDIFKTESVYAKADASGRITSVELEVVLRADGEDEIRDVSTLHNIRNTEGDEEYTVSSGTEYLWENKGADIHYKGDGAKELPVDVRITYTLDGEEIEPHDLAGRSGHLIMRFDYDNHTSRTLLIDGRSREACVPFLAISAVFLPEETFSHVEVENGEVSSMDGTNVAVGFVMPGLSDCLKLDEVEAAEDVDIPDHFVVEADVTDFELDFTVTILTNGLMEDMDLGDLDDLDDLKDGIRELMDASDEILDGIGELCDGAVEFDVYLGEYISGVVMLYDGCEQLDTGLQEYVKKKNEMMDKTAALAAGLDSLDKALKDTEGFKDAPSGMDAAAAAVKALKADNAELVAELETVGSAIDGMNDLITKVKAFASEVESGTKSIQSSVNSANEQNEALQASLGNLSSQLDAAGQQLDPESDAAALELIAQAKASLAVAQGQSGTITGYLSDANTQLNALTVPEFPDSIPDLQGVTERIEDMNKQLKIIDTYSEGLNQLLAGVDSVHAAVSGLASGELTIKELGTELQRQMTELGSGVDTLAAGVHSLRDGGKALVEAGGELNEGYDLLIDGIKELRDGYKEFDEEGIHELEELTGDEWTDLVGRVKALKEADLGYQCYAGIPEGRNGKVSFIIETEEIR